MTEPIWVLRETVLALQLHSLSLFGGLAGIRDETLLDSALQRPINLFEYGQNPSVPELGAAYAFGLVKNHPFLDGNKRIAFLTATVFLEANELVFSGDQAEAVINTLALAAGELDEAGFAAWLATNSAPAS
ncbi:MAG: type II toxin-antitoxin system death-on-curing family toxin [Synoicihabitans sp.]